MKKTTLDSSNKSFAANDERNIFQIWRDLGEKIPFAVRRRDWSERYYTVVEKIEIKKWPYGNAYGYPTENGRKSDHYEYDNGWKKYRLIPCAGCYQWTLVKDAMISKDFSILIEALPKTRSQPRQKLVKPKKPGAYTLEEIHVQFPKAYAKWTMEDDERLTILFQFGKTIDELAPLFQRKVSAIESRLVKLGLLQDRLKMTQDLQVIK